MRRLAACWVAIGMLIAACTSSGPAHQAAVPTFPGLGQPVPRPPATFRLHSEGTDRTIGALVYGTAFRCRVGCARAVQLGRFFERAMPKLGWHETFFDPAVGAGNWKGHGEAVAIGPVVRDRWLKLEIAFCPPSEICFGA